MKKRLVVLGVMVEVDLVDETGVAPAATDAAISDTVVTRGFTVVGPSAREQGRRTNLAIAETSRRGQAWQAS